MRRWRKRDPRRGKRFARPAIDIEAQAKKKL